MVRWLTVALLLPGCEGIIPAAEEEPTCELSLDNLDGRTFVSVEATPTGDRLNPIARVKFVEKEGQTLAKYTVASPSDVYELPCTIKEKEEQRTLFCAEEARPQDWCQALLVADEVCSKKVLRKFGATQTDEELNEAIIEAKKNWRKYRGTEYEKQFILNNNNLGNKLQGRLYVDIDDRRCRLSVGDYYWTIYNGRGVEDTNPVGQNPFAEVKDQEYRFEHCAIGNIIPGIETEELPDDLSEIPSRGRKYATGKAYWYHYLGEEGVKAKDGCTYAFDLWANFKRAKTNVPVEPENGKLTWKVQHTFSEDDQVALWGDSSKPLGVLTMVRYEQCEGEEKEKIDVVCEAGLLVDEIVVDEEVGGGEDGEE